MQKSFKHYYHEVISLEQAKEILFQELKNRIKLQIASEVISVKDSLYRITAEPVFAKISSPYFYSSAMDGYAVRAEDTFSATEKNPVLLVERIFQQPFYQHNLQRLGLSEPVINPNREETHIFIKLSKLLDFNSTATFVFFDNEIKNHPYNYPIYDFL